MAPSARCWIEFLRNDFHFIVGTGLNVFRTVRLCDRLFRPLHAPIDCASSAMPSPDTGGYICYRERSSFLSRTLPCCTRVCCFGSQLCVARRMSRVAVCASARGHLLMDWNTHWAPARLLTRDANLPHLFLFFFNARPPARRILLCQDSTVYHGMSLVSSVYAPPFVGFLSVGLSSAFMRQGRRIVYMIRAFTSKVRGTVARTAAALHWSVASLKSFPSASRLRVNKGPASTAVQYIVQCSCRPTMSLVER